MPMMEGTFSDLCTGLALQVTTHYVNLIASYIIIHICYHSDSSLPGGFIKLKVNTGLEIYTRPLVFTSSLSVRTSENCY